MSTGTGFLIGVGSVAVALSLGFAGGYVLTAPDEAAKIKPAAYNAPAKNEKNEPLQAKTETSDVKAETKPEPAAPLATSPALSSATIPVIAKPAETVGLSSHEDSISASSTSPVQASAPPEPAAPPAIQASAPVAAPPEERVVTSRSEPRHREKNARKSLREPDVNPTADNAPLDLSAEADGSAQSNPTSMLERRRGRLPKRKTVEKPEMVQVIDAGDAQQRRVLRDTPVVEDSTPQRGGFLFGLFGN